MTDTLKAKLAERMRAGNVLVVVGTGVSLASTGDAKLASWKGLIANGVEYCVALGLRDHRWAATHKELLEGDLNDLISVAEQVSRRLGYKPTEPCGGDWSGWLRATVGGLRAENLELIEAIRDLHAPIATLNYDDLLLTNMTGLRSITWQRPERWLPVLQGEDDAILHLHGHWDQPSSVVLGIRSYDAAMGQQLAQALQRALASLRSLVFIGCSATLEDPNFSALLTWMSEQLRGAEHSHYLLIPEVEPLPIAEPLLREARVVPLRYGKSHDELLPFIRDLAFLADVPKRRKREHEQTLPAPPRDAHERLLAGLTGFGRILVDTAAEPIQSAETRRNLFLRSLTWENVCRGGYAERPVLGASLLPAFERFLDGRSIVAGRLKLPIFWIGGRSGDGKSVLLLQLCLSAQRAGCAFPFVQFHLPDHLFDWIEARLQEGPRQDEQPTVVTVADDLHKVSNWGRALRLLEMAATTQMSIAIVTCGPTPERSFFLQETDSYLGVTRIDTPHLNADDVILLGKHLHIELPASNVKGPTLVEQLFLKLAVEKQVSIENFAHSLKARVDARVFRETLLEELTAMTWIDLPLPFHLVEEAEMAWLDTLADETQLHCERAPDGFRFGHPAIAGFIFNALTRKRESAESLTSRVARTMSRLIPQLGSTAAVTRALRQVTVRLTAEAEIDETEVLTRVYEAAKDSKVAAAAAVFIIYKLNSGNTDIGSKWRRAARTFRANRTIEPSTRAFLARNLVASVQAEKADLSVALDLTGDPKVGPYLGSFLDRMVADKYRKKGWTFIAINYAVSWANANREQAVTQDILTGFLSHYPRDTRIRDAVQEFARETDPRRISSKLMTVIAKYMEDDLSTEIDRWLVIHRHGADYADVLAALLAKPGNEWVAVAREMFNMEAPRDQHWFHILAVILPHLEDDEPLVSYAKAVARAHISDSAAGQLFEVLAAKGRNVEAGEVVCSRLKLLWSEGLFDANAREAIHLFQVAWGSLAGDHDFFETRIDEIFRRLNRLEQEAATNVVNNTSKKSRSLLRHAITTIVRSSRNAPLYAPHALAFLDARPDHVMAGTLAGRLLLLSRTLSPQDHADLIADLRKREAFLIETAWFCAEENECLDQQERVLPTIALQKTLWESEPERIRSLILGYLYPSVRTGAVQVLSAWLADERCTNEAWRHLLDSSIDTDAHNRARASVVARSLDLTFEKLISRTLNTKDENFLLSLLEHGVGDFERNPASAWAILQRRERWPAQSVPFLWRGVLRSCLLGFTLRREDFWLEFAEWQREKQDPVCRLHLEEMRRSL